MYTKKVYPILGLLTWTKRDIYKFLIISVIPVTLYAIFDFKFLHLPWLPIAVLGTAVAFIIGFKNNASYDRVWEARKIWGGIVNASRSWGIMVRDFTNNKHVKNDRLTEEELHQVKVKIIKRHVAWMAAHRYALRTAKPWESAATQRDNAEYNDKYLDIKEHKIPLKEALEPYLDPEELNYVMSKTNKATTLISLQSKHIKELEGKGHIWEFSFLEMENMLVELYTLQGKNERIKNFPYPRQFATLNFCFVWIFILLLPFGVIGAFDEMGHELMGHMKEINGSGLKASYTFIARHFVWLSVPFCTIISWVFNTMERVGDVTENPFEGTPNDVPITSMSRGIEIDLLEMLDEKDIPKPIPTVHDIQM